MAATLISDKQLKTSYMHFSFHSPHPSHLSQQFGLSTTQWFGRLGTMKPTLPTAPYLYQQRDLKKSKKKTSWQWKYQIWVTPNGCKQLINHKKHIMNLCSTMLCELLNTASDCTSQNPAAAFPMHVFSPHYVFLPLALQLQFPLISEIKPLN